MLNMKSSKFSHQSIQVFIQMADHIAICVKNSDGQQGILVSREDAKKIAKSLEEFAEEKVTSPSRGKE